MSTTVTVTVGSTVAATGDCYDCCDGVPVDCEDCISIPSSYLFTLSGTGDLAFLNGETVTVDYLGLSGGYFNFSGTAVIDGWTVEVGWSIENNSACNSFFGNIQLSKAGECGNQIQEMEDPALTTSFSCAPPTFTITAQMLYINGEVSEGQCFTGTTGGVGVEA